MKEIKMILRKCNSSLEAICVVISALVMLLICPVVFGTAIHWLCGVLYFTTEILIVPGLIKLFNDNGWLDEE